MIINNTLRILCFGDSLTAGWSLSTHPVLHPYAGALEASLHTAFPSMNISTTVHGWLGDRTECPPNVCPGFLLRMDNLYKDPPSYTFALILGGTNDLTAHRTAPDIFSSLQKVWSIPLSHNTKVLALTVPECGDCHSVHDKSQTALNEMIMKHEAENLYTFDLYQSIPYRNMTSKKRKEIWDDIIHFTPKGYDLMGKILAERMVDILKSEEEPMHGELKR